MPFSKIVNSEFSKSFKIVIPARERSETGGICRRSNVFGVGCESSIYLQATGESHSERRTTIYNRPFLDTSRIAGLLAPFLTERDSLSAIQLDQISTYIDLLIRWNSRVNLTAIRAPDEIVTRHFGESLFAACHLFPRGARDSNQNPPPEVPTGGRLVDIGSGAGFPGLPIKLWSPNTPVTLIESNHKKVAFLREVARALTLTDIDVFPGRAEDFPPASAAIVTLRAVERFDRILPTATRLLATPGRLALLISEAQLPQARIAAPSLQWRTTSAIPLSFQRVLALCEVQGSTG